VIGISLGLCLVMDFSISSLEHLGSTTRGLVSLLVNSS